MSHEHKKYITKIMPTSLVQGCEVFLAQLDLLEDGLGRNVGMAALIQSGRMPYLVEMASHVGPRLYLLLLLCRQ